MVGSVFLVGWFGTLMLAREKKNEGGNKEEEKKKKQTHADERHGKGRGGQHELKPDQLVAAVVELDVDIVFGVVDVLAKGLEAVEGVVDLSFFFRVFPLPPVVFG